MRLVDTQNGALLDIAQQEAVCHHRLELVYRRIAVVVLGAPSWPRIERVAETVVLAVDTAAAGTNVEGEILSSRGALSDNRRVRIAGLLAFPVIASCKP